ncbi:hypothetical protein O7627_07825 [Solwaraspora sp. WMMD1047]|uniref:hypothetical protein n=1 Tax=Solwaraspora sp. WMMD1047 TaxID=3016102 RepID=UPI00241807CA|nr:hypothetical protein [Solwaraspora sp. WMMD1047]MDG4829214.1 hypothetical protein [Solwaraspora sp. WMMD1047]
MTRSSAAADAARTAMVEISVAAAVIPSAWPVAQIVYFHQCDPLAIIQAGVNWLDLHDRLDDARRSAGPDRPGVRSQVVAVVVGVTLLCVGTMLFLLVVAYAVVSTILAAFAHQIATAAASAAAGSAAACLSAANSFAASALTTLRHLESMASAIGKRGATAIARAMVLDPEQAQATVERPTAAGMDALRELARATIDDSDRVVTNLLAGWARDPDEAPGWGALFAST